MYFASRLMSSAWKLKLVRAIFYFPVSSAGYGCLFGFSNTLKDGDGVVVAFFNYLNKLFCKRKPN